MAADDLSSIQLYYLQQLRQKMPNKIISYTFPAANYPKSDTVRTINFPFRDVVLYGQQYLNTINVFRADDETVNEMMYDLGVPKSKVSTNRGVDEI